MDQVTSFREKYQQGTAYMSEDLKSIEKSANGVFAEEENLQLEQEYMSAMEQGHARMRMFGIHSSTFGKAQNVTPAGMQDYCTERQETRRTHQIAQSAKKKKSRQREDAKVRMGERVTQQIQRSAGRSAAQVLQLYTEKKQNPQVLADEVPMQGTEFYTSVKNEAMDAQMKEQNISDLLIKRDALAEKIKNAKKASGVIGRAEQDYDKQLLERLNDALQTWMLVGGVSTNGKRVSDREKAKALQRLPLAIQNYEYHVKNRGMLIGGVVFEQVKKTTAYEESYKEWQEVDLQSSHESLGIDQPIANIYKDDIASLRSLISENGPYDPDKQQLITKVYAEYMQHSVAFAKRNLEFKAAVYATLSRPKYKEYLDAWWAKNDFVSRQHELAMDAAEAYLKYLIKGKNPDPTLAVYIENHWHMDQFAQDLDQKAGEIYADPQAYANRIEESRERIRQNTQLDQERRQYLLSKLDDIEANPLNQQAERLHSVSAAEIGYTQFVNQNCQITAHDPNGAGYRDIVRLMMPLNGTVDSVDAKQAKACKAGLVKFAKGIYLGDQTDENGQVIEGKKDNTSCPEAERLAELPALQALLRQSQRDLQQYVDNSDGAFGKISLREAYRSVDIMVNVHKKAQGMRDACGEICKSNLFGKLDEATREQLVNAWDFASALTFIARDRSTIISGTCERTLREMIEGGDSSLKCLDKTLEDYVVESHQMHEKVLAGQQ